jgi:hypothetical protein
VQRVFQESPALDLKMGVFVEHPLREVVRVDQQIDGDIGLRRTVQQRECITDSRVRNLTLAREDAAGAELHLDDVHAIAGELLNIGADLAEVAIANEEDGAGEA